MNNAYKIKKKREIVLIKTSEILDDLCYTDISIEDCLVKLKYNMELDPFLKNNQEDIKEIVNYVELLLKKIFDIK